jgi:hypothetical protein
MSKPPDRKNGKPYTEAEKKRRYRAKKKQEKEDQIE